MFRVKFIFGASLGILCLYLSACGKPPVRPELPGPAPVSSDPLEPLILGKQLSPQDLKTLIRVFNKEWGENLTTTELSAWVDFLNQWLYQDAQSSGSLLQIIKQKIQEKGFSFWEKKLEDLFRNSPELQTEVSEWVKDERFLPFLKRAVELLGSQFFTQVVELFLFNSHLFVSKTDGVIFDNKLFFEDITKILQDENKTENLSALLEKLTLSQWIPAVSGAGRATLSEFGESAFPDLIKSLNDHIQPLSQAVKLAHLLNRSGDKIVKTLQEGLRANPDSIQALTLKWEPILTKSLSKLIRSSLLQPEDGQKLTKTFWLKLGAQPTHASTDEFVRLYSIIYSGIQKIADPRRFEAQLDSGSYRLPLQLNALFLTRYLEQVANQKHEEMQSWSEETFEQKLWEGSAGLKEFQLSLKDESVKTDLKALGLTSTLSRLEKLFQEEDSGKQDYSFVLSDERQSLETTLDEAVRYAHSLKPFFDVTPLLVGFFQEVSHQELKGAFPNLLAQAQGALSQLNSNQWQSLKKIIFEDFKLAQLEPEDRMLILGLFQSDEEVANWVNEVLIHLESIQKLDVITPSGTSIFRFYLSILRQLNPEEILHLGDALSLVSSIELLSESEEQGWKFPGLIGWVKHGTALGQLLRGLAGLNPQQERLASVQLESFFGKKDREEKGSSLVVYWLKKAAKRLPALIECEINPVTDLKLLSLQEREWLEKFSKKGGLDELAQLVKPSKSVLIEIRQLSQKGVVDRGLRFLGQIENERMREISRVFLDWDRSGEFESVLNLVSFFKKGEVQ